MKSAILGRAQEGTNRMRKPENELDAAGQKRTILGNKRTLAARKQFSLNRQATTKKTSQHSTRSATMGWLCQVCKKDYGGEETDSAPPCFEKPDCKKKGAFACKWEAGAVPEWKFTSGDLTKPSKASDALSGPQPVAGQGR
jgi:hypothetical protein